MLNNVTKTYYGDTYIENLLKNNLIKNVFNL